jgi:hypothetical protein
LLLGLLAAFLIVVAAILLGLGLVQVIRTLAGTASPWYGRPLPTRVALWGGVLLCGASIGSGFARRSGFWGLGLGTWLLWLILSLVLNLTLIGGTAVILVPALWAALLIAVVVLSGLSRSRVARAGAFIAAALLAAVVWLQLALLFECAVGFEQSPAVTLSVSLVASTLAPMFALSEKQAHMRKWLALSIAAVVVVACSVAVILGSG